MSLKQNILPRDIKSAEPVAITEWVQRITAPNPSVMTGPGTNTYLIGKEKIAVLDPGPLIEGHVDAIIRASKDKIAYVVVTHTHPDHSPAAMEIARRTGAQLVGATIENDGHQDLSFKPDHIPTDGWRLPVDEYQLNAVHTPGHVGNHYCFYLANDKMLFTGDHIMEGTTVVIIPPYGDMRDYIRSLQKLNEHFIEFLAPAHGHVMIDAKAVINQLVNHRLQRESLVVNALQKIDGGDLNALLPHAYADVDKKLYPIAKYSLWAHLLKLEKDGQVRRENIDDFAQQNTIKDNGDGECWQLINA